MNTQQNEKGALITMVLVFGAIFLLLLGGLLSFILLQHRGSIQRVASQEALHTAEAGLDYYRWRLIHFPDDLTDPGGPIHAYSDATNTVQGSFSLDIQGTTQCGETTGATITSTGWTDDFPNVQRTVQAKYLRPTVADFSFLLNSDVWAGSDRVITGPYHSNGGIHMAGENLSVVTSARATWNCSGSFGCSPSDPNAPGVVTLPTENGNAALFSFPVPQFDFAGITVDLAAIKDLTDTQGEGIYLGPSPSGLGYHLVFQGDTVDVYDITGFNRVDAYDSQQGWHDEYSVITAETSIGAPLSIPEDCSVMFVEDSVWVEGVVEGKVTLAAADLITPSVEADAWLIGDVTYSSGVPTTTDGFVLLAQHNNLVGLDVPDNMQLHGVFVAQTGRFGRNHYNCSETVTCNNYQKDNLDIVGTIVSDGRVGTKWNCSGVYCSGFQNRTATYDPQQGVFPPAFLPVTSPEFGIQDWEEVE